MYAMFLPIPLLAALLLLIMQIAVPAKPRKIKQ
jgi:hypothetical protein